MNEPATAPDPAEGTGEPITLTLRDIARWQLPHLAQRSDQEKPKILPGLPSLQRGAVWKPNQIELLWDSVLRGFPIGSMVVSKRLDRQDTRAGAVGGPADRLPWDECEYTHHLLDGQQRANAVALGYFDPFPESQVDSQVLDPEALLWLDLDPDRPGSSLFPTASSRSFLLRVTTMAHPWGFKVSDDKEPKRVEHHKAREATRAFDEAREATRAFDDIRKRANNKRPHPRDGWPYESNVPIPMAWALDAAHRVYGDTREPPGSGQAQRDLWRCVLERCKRFLRDPPDHDTADSPPQSATATGTDPLRSWASRAEALLQEWCDAFPEHPPNQAMRLAGAVARAVQAQIVVLPLPDDALTQPSRTDEHIDSVNGTENHQSISNVEHLFLRLNSGGTDLDGDELRFSMIKAYWPGIENTIQTIDPRPPDIQVALLGARLALDDGKLPATPTVETLRGLATVNQLGLGGDKEEDKRRLNRRRDLEKVERAFGLRPTPTTPGSASAHGNQDKAPVARAFETLDEWFLHREDDQDWGLPKVLRSRLAEQAPDVFLLLLRLVNAHKAGAPPPDAAIRRKLLGLATVLHWFGKDRVRAVRHLWETEPLQWLDGTAFSSRPHLLTTLSALEGKDNSKPSRTVVGILTPEELESYIDEASLALDNIHQWRWWETLVVERAKNKVGADANPKQLDLIDVLTQKERATLLLMYAQRAQMAHEFHEYDPSRVGYWELHNVPWDFDHILPQNAFYNRRQQNTYLKVCQEWGHTIANLHIWPFEKNRGRHDQQAKESLPSEEDELRRMLLWDDAAESPDRRPFFSLTGHHVEDSEADASLSRQKVYDFVVNARSRLLRIYRDWFKTLHIQDLL